MEMQCTDRPLLGVCHLQEEMRQSVAPAEPVQYYFTLAQQPGAVQVQGAQPAQQPGAQTATTIQPGQIIIAQPQQGQVLRMPSLKIFFSHRGCLKAGETKAIIIRANAT